MIKFEHVTKTFGTKTVLDDLTLHIPKGKITFIIGKSGEGKSVTIKHIIGLLKPDSGQITVDGQNLADFSLEELRFYRRKYGMLFQHAALFDSMTVGENVMFPLKEHSNESLFDRLKKVDKMLEMVGLPDLQNKFPNELSIGEKKRVGLARALAMEPEAMLYDEPTTGMDPLVSEMIDELITTVSKEQKNLTSIVISHDLKAALSTAENIIMLYKGRVALSGPPDDFRSSRDPVVRQFFAGKIEGPMEFM